jgi:predicted small metal-binding protein
MKYSIACKDLGMQGCDHVVTGSTLADVKTAATAHAQQVHSDMFKSLSPQQIAGMDKMMESVAKTA